MVRHQGVALALLAVGDVLEDEKHAMGMIARLRNLAGVQVEDAPAETGKIILDLETLDRLVFRQHLLHQMAKRRHVPLVLAQFGNAPSCVSASVIPKIVRNALLAVTIVMSSSSTTSGSRIVSTMLLRQLPVALALVPGRALLADILDGEQDEAVMIAGAKDLAGVDQHRAPADGRKIMLDLEAFDRCAMRDHALEQSAQRGNVPLPVAEVVDKTALGLGGARAKRLVERAIGGCDVQISVENDERAGHGLDDVARSNVLARTSRWILRRIEKCS